MDTVFCTICQDEINELKVKLIDVTEDKDGDMVVIFQCPDCSTTRKSHLKRGNANALTTICSQ